MVVLLLLAVVLRAEDFVVVKETTLSSSSEAVTIQQPAAAAATVRFVAAWVDCSGTCTITVERNGTAASSTALTRIPVNNTGSTSKATAWSASNVGTGTVISKFTLLNGGGVPIGLSGVVLTGNGTTKNITIRTDTSSVTVHINIRWTELP